MLETVIAATLTVATAVPASASDDMVTRWETPHTVCVESHMGSGWSSDDAATQLADDTIWYWDLVHGNGEGSCDGHDQIIRLHRADDPDKARAWTSISTVWIFDEDGERFKSLTSANVYMNVGHPQSWTWEQNRRTWVHELGHAMGLPHSDECDSIMSHSYACYSQHDTFTDLDKDVIRDVYEPWLPTFEIMTL